MSTTEFTPVEGVVSPTPVLNEVTPPKEIVRYLSDHVGLTQAELQEVIGADARTIRRWATSSDSSEPQARFFERIDDLRALVTLLADTLPGEQTGRWLRARNRYLRNARPLDLLASGDFEQVYEAGEAYVAGAPI